MIAFLHGIVRGTTMTSVYLDVNGVGFEVGMSSKGLARLPETGQPADVFTYLQVREDGMALYGFLTSDEKALFEKLIGVSGVGPKVALAVLSVFDPEELAAIVSAQDTARMAKAPGVGKKTAQRIILELKGSFDDVELVPSRLSSVPSAVDGVTEALLAMGFTSRETELALLGAPEGAGESVLLQYALKKLGSPA